MCNPVLIALGSLALSAGSRIASAIGESKRASENKEFAQEAFIADVSDIIARISEEQDAAAQKINQSFKASRKAASTARVAAGEAGVAGISVDLLLDDVARQQGEFVASVEDNLARTTRNLDRQIRGAGIRRDSRTNAVRAPSFLSTALRIGGSGLDFLTPIISRKNATRGA